MFHQLQSTNVFTNINRFNFLSAWLFVNIETFVTLIIHDFGYKGKHQAFHIQITRFKTFTPRSGKYCGRFRCTGLHIFFLNYDRQYFAIYTQMLLKYGTTNRLPICHSDLRNKLPRITLSLRREFHSTHLCHKNWLSNLGGIAPAAKNGYLA